MKTLVLLSILVNVVATALNLWAISDVITSAIVTGFFGLVGTCLAGVIAYMHYQLTKTTEAVHTLGNSNMGVQLRLNAELSRWKANQTHDQSDDEAATAAERLLKDHISKQEKVDAHSE